MTIQDLAGEALNHFESKLREGGGNFYCHKDSAPEWVTDLTREAHDGMLPDDFKFETVIDALGYFSECEEGQEDDYQPEACVYTGRLTNWLASSLTRVGYVDQACEDLCVSQETGLVQRLMIGQEYEMREIFASVLDSLRERLSELEAA